MLRVLLGLTAPGELRRWLAVQKPASPIGVPFSGGIDSGAVLLCLNSLLLRQGLDALQLQ